MFGWDGNLIEFEDKVIYICDRGRKFQDDFDQINVEATCKPEYTWDLPVWGQCIESNDQFFIYSQRLCILLQLFGRHIAHLILVQQLSKKPK